MSDMRAALLEAPFRLPAALRRSDLVAKYFRGLGDQTRVRILELLRDEGELTVGELVERVDRELRTDAEVRLVHVVDQRTAQRLRFLGSPTIRVDGIDIDPQTEQRTDYALSCRVFTTEHGPAGQPDERWIRDALTNA